MTDAPVRSAPIGAYLAIVAGGLALLALALPWYTLDTEAFKAAFQRVMDLILGAGGGDTSLNESAQGQAFAQMASDRAATKINGSLHGYQDSIIWVAVRVVTVIGAVLAALKVLQGETSGASQRNTFLGIGVAFAIRPVMNLLNNPFARYDGSEAMFGINPSELVAPASGIYVALLAAGLMVAAGMFAHLGDEVVVQEASTHTAPTSGVHVPGMAAAPKPAAYVPPGPPQTASAHVPAPYVPPGPPQVAPAGAHSHAPYRPAAPQPIAASAYVPMQPAASPFAHTAPVLPPSDAPRRSSSVAPPGL